MFVCWLANFNYAIRNTLVSADWLTHKTWCSFPCVIIYHTIAYTILYVRITHIVQKYNTRLKTELMKFALKKVRHYIYEYNNIYIDLLYTS